MSMCMLGVRVLRWNSGQEFESQDRCRGVKRWRNNLVENEESNRRERRSILFRLDNAVSAIDADFGAGNELRRITCEEDNCALEVFRITHLFRKQTTSAHFVSHISTKVCLPFPSGSAPPTCASTPGRAQGSSSSTS